MVHHVFGVVFSVRPREVPHRHFRTPTLKFGSGSRVKRRAGGASIRRARRVDCRRRLSRTRPFAVLLARRRRRRWDQYFTEIGLSGCSFQQTGCSTLLDPHPSPGEACRWIGGRFSGWARDTRIHKTNLNACSPIRLNCTTHYLVIGDWRSRQRCSMAGKIITDISPRGIVVLLGRFECGRDMMAVYPILHHLPWCRTGPLRIQ